MDFINETIEVTVITMARVRKVTWSEDEDSELLEGYRAFGKQWVKICHLLPTKASYHDIRKRLKSLDLKEKVNAIDAVRKGDDIIA